MKKHLFHGLLAFLLVFSLLPFPTHRARAATWTVTSTGDFWGSCPHTTDCTLRTAIAWSSSGDTITFGVSGTITIALGAGFWVDKQLTIDGTGQNVVIAAGNTTGVAFNFVSGSNGSILRNITVEGATGSNSPLIAIYQGLTIGPNVTIQDNTAPGGVGVVVYSGGSATITGVGGSTTLISGNASYGIYVDSGGSLTVGSNVTIQNNGSDGIGIAGGSGAVTITGVSGSPVIVQNNGGQGINVLRNGVTVGPDVQVNGNTGNGVQFSGVTGGTVTGSTIQNNGQNGILVYNASGITIQNSIIRNNGMNGIAVSASTLPATTNLQISGNTITGNTAEGINFWGVGGNTVQGNYIGTDASLAALPNTNSGISMAYGASNNTIDGNTIGYNTYQNVLISGNGTDNNTLTNNVIFSDACNISPTNDNTGVIIINGAQNNTVGPGNRIYCHQFDGIQVVGQGTDNNRILGNQGGTVTNCTLAGVSGSVIACNGRGISIINEYGNVAFPSVSPPSGTRPNGPDGTIVQQNLIARNRSDGLYSVLSTGTTIGGTFADANTFQNNQGNGALIVGSTGTFIGNQVLDNGADGIRLEPHYGLFANGRDPNSYTDDTVSNFDIRNNTFNNNGRAGIRGRDNEADPGQTPAQLNTSNSFSGSGDRIVQEWFGAVEVLDSANNPVTTLSFGAITSSTCGTSHALQTSDGIAWGPSNNGLGYGAFNLTNVGTWFLIRGYYVDNNGNYVNCDPYTISASRGALSGNALFSFDGNASTHPVSPDPGIPYTRPNQTVNGRYQVAQVTLSAPPPPPAPSALPATGFPMGRITALGAPRVAYRATEIVLEIPSLGVKAPIVGVPKSNGSWDVSWLGNSVGWLEGSAFPTWKGNTVLTAHVWNADNTPGIFNQIKTLKYGDRFYIHAFGQTYIYEVRENTWLWGANRVDKVFKHEELDWVTLLTCEGYNPLTSNYLFRRMVRAVLMEVRPAH